MAAACWLFFLCRPCLLPAQSREPPLVRFAVIGDSGTGDAHQFRIGRQMLAWHERLPFTLVLMLGDNIYGSERSGVDQKYFGEKFDRPYAGLLARGVVFRATLGNHDVGIRDGRDQIEAYDRFHIGGPRGYYSFTAGALGDGTPLVQFFVVNTVRLKRNGQDPEQLAWLEQALTSSRARWRILYGHHPLHSTGQRHGGDLALRAKLEPLLAGRVHVVLAGHDHVYERFYPQRGIVYFVCGSSGKLRRGDSRPNTLVAAVEDQQRAFMLWEATPTELRFRAIHEKGDAFDCGVTRLGSPSETVGCSALATEDKEHGKPAEKQSGRILWRTPCVRR